MDGPSIVCAPEADPEPLSDVALVDVGEALWTERQITWVTWGLVVLGIVVRLARYASDFPLWGDEAFVAVNFIGSGYRELLRPLLYGQICPLLFLWGERTAVLLFGYNVLALRLLSVICGVASLVLFRHVVGRVVRGIPWVMAVGILAVSIHPIRHSAEVKPYACDLLVALLLLAPAIEWLRTPRRVGWLWVLAAIVPIALAASHPAVFVAGGVAIGLALPVWKSRRGGARLAFAAYSVALVATFVLLYFLFAARQSHDAMKGLRGYWAASFPPLDRPGALVSWLLQIHTGTMFAYPGGGRHGASTATFVCFVGGAIVLWRQGRKALSAMLLGPFALALLAAALRHYPYGGEARQMQFVAPMICLLTALGANALLRAVPKTRDRRRLSAGALILLVAGGLHPLVHDLRHPYHFVYDRQAREWAQRFWPAQAREAELLCFRWDCGIAETRSLNLRTAIYLCNQFLCSPHRRQVRPTDWNAISATRPLRCVLFFETRPDHPHVLAYLAQIRTVLQWRRTERLEFKTDGALAGTKTEHVLLYEFVPRSPDQDRVPVDHAPPGQSPRVGLAGPGGGGASRGSKITR